MANVPNSHEDFVDNNRWLSLALAVLGIGVGAFGIINYEGNAESAHLGLGAIAIAVGGYSYFVHTSKFDRMQGRA